MRYALRYKLRRDGIHKTAEQVVLVGGSLIGALKVGAKINCLFGRKKATGFAENKVGYENISVRYNKRVTADDFVVLHVENSPLFDVSYLEAKIKKCLDEDISVGLVLDTKAKSLDQIYHDFDFIEAIMTKYKIDFPIYLNIEGIVNNKKLNQPMKEAIIDSFLNKAEESKMYVGIYGSDTTLTLCNEYVYNLNDYDCFLVQDKEDIEYPGTYHVVKDGDGDITSSINLAEIIEDNNLNKASNFVLSSPVFINDKDEVLTYAIESGLSVDELKKYNKGLTDSKDILFIPNIFNRELKNSYSNSRENNADEIARGIDISNFQSTIDWREVSENMDFVIVEVARGSGYLSSAKTQIKETLNHSLSLGIYFLIDKEMDAKTYETRINTYLDKLDGELSNEIKNHTYNAQDIPVFLDFEAYTEANDYYALMDVFRKSCISHGYKKVGIYGNKSTLSGVVKQVNKYLQENTSYEDIEDWGFYVWEAGGKFYSAREKTHQDDITLDKLKPEENNSRYSDGTYLYTPDILQATNVCTDTGAYNSLNHCDVSFLYDLDLFGENNKQDEDNILRDIDLGTERIINLDKYPNLPTYQILCNLDYLLTGVYTGFMIKVVGRLLIIKLKDEVLKLKR